MKTGRLVDPPLEKHVQADVVRLLTSLGAAVYVLGTRRPRSDWQGTRQTAGLPDLLAFLKRPGHAGREFVVIECKRQGGRLSPAQEGFREVCQLADVPHIIGGLDDVMEWLTDRGYLLKPARDGIKRADADATG